MSRFLNSVFFTKEKAESLLKIRIIKTNLIHVHGFPKSLAKNSILNSPEYFGQYGTIVNTIISEKINPDNNRKVYSAYITYSNKIEASLAILCVDSLMIKGKIIRAFFGTTKYCSYFLNNECCPNSDKCLFLHQCASNKDIIIEPRTVFNYNDHLNLAKEILKISHQQTRNLLRTLKKPEKNVFPTIDFIFMNEEEKENYLNQGNLTYVKGKNKDLGNSNFFNININSNINNNINNNINKFNYEDSVYKNVSINSIINQKVLNSSIENINNLNESIDLHKIFETSIKYILLLKPYLNNIDKKYIKKMEFEFLKNDLVKKGLNIYKLLDGCLDCINDIF